MASPAQIAANRRNSLRSTGPTSVAGKSVSRFNAIKSGIHAKSLLIPGEDAAELEALTANYHLQFLPASPVEQFLVDTLIHTDWRLRRLRNREAELSDPATRKPSHEDLLDRLDRQIHSAERAWFRALKELQSQIPARIQKELAEFEAAHATASPQAELAPEIGFVPQSGESIAESATAAVPLAELRPQMGSATRPERPVEPKPAPKINLALRL
jgi:hypothetical protein